jgi:hypothetical protein
MKHVLLLVVGGFSAVNVLAQDFTLSVSSPARNAVAAPRNQPLRLTLTQPIGTGAAGLQVFSSRRGRLSGTPVVSGNTLTLTPARPLVAGEVVSVTVPATLQSTTGSRLPAAQVYQFTAATAAGPGTFIGSTAAIVGNAAASGTPPSVAQVHTADVDNDGDLDLLTANGDYAPGTVSVRLNNGGGLFTGTATVDVGDFPGQLITADIDGDGDLDLLTCAGNSVSVRLNNGQGSFVTGHPNLTAGLRPRALLAGDIDGDGDLDILVSNSGDTSVSVLLNDGQGAFSLSATISGGISIALGDLDNDGDLDLITHQDGAASITVRLNTGGGSFSSTPISVTPANFSTPSQVLVADLNGDGSLDIVTSGSSGVHRFANDGTAHFSSPTTISSSSQGYLHTTDLDGDGDLDLLAARFNGSVISSLLNNGSGTFSPSSSPVLTVTGKADLFEPADLDGDGDVDLLVAGSGAQIRTRFNQEPASLFAVTTVAPGPNVRNAPRSGTVAVSFSQPLATPPATDSRLHVFSAQRGGRLAGQTTAQGSTLTFAPQHQLQPGERVAVTVVANDPTGNTRLTRSRVFEFTTAVAGGTGAFGGGTRIPAGQFTDYMAAADIDGDYDLDLLTATAIGNGITEIEVWRNNGSGTYAADPRVSVGGDLSGLIMADIDSDGDLDLLASTGSHGYTNSPARVSIRLNDGTGSFTVRPPLELTGLPQDIVAGDIDGDGDLDVLTAATSGLGINLNRGDATFDAIATQSNTSLERIALGDVDNDGDLDLLTTNTAEAGVCLNDGKGVFAARQPVSVANRGALAAGDVDGDGDLDLLTSNSYAVSISLNDGTGQFSAGSVATVAGGGFGYRHLAVGDVDNDGDLDLLSGGGSLDGQVSVRLNNGAGVFSGGSDPVVGASLSMPAKVLLADTDRDGDLDLIAATYAAGGVSIQLNGGTGPLLAASGAAAGAQPLAVYPNPAHDKAWVKVPRGTANVVLLNALGQHMRSVAVDGSATLVSLALAGLPTGLYVVQVGAATQRLVIE